MSFDLCDSRDGVRRFFTHEGDDALAVHTTANFILNLAKKAKFRADENRCTGNACIEMTDAGKLFIKMIGAGFEQTFWSFPSHRFDPRFMLVVDAVREHELARQALLPAPSNDHVVRIAESLNACVTRIHDTAKVADHLYKAFAPNLVMLPGTHAWNGVANASTGRTGLRRARAIDHTSGCVRIRRQAGQLPE